MRNRNKGEGLVNVIIILVLVILACVVAAETLGQEIITLIVGSKGRADYAASRMDQPQPQPNGGGFPGNP